MAGSLCETVDAKPATPAADARFSALWAMGVPWPVGAVALIVELRYRGVWPGFMWLPTPPDWGRADRALMALGLFAAATGAGLTAVWLRPEPWTCPWWVRLPLAAGLLVSGVAVLAAELRKVRP